MKVLVILWLLYLFLLLVGEPEGANFELVSPPRLQTNDIPYDSLGLGGSGLGWCRIVWRCRCHGNDV